MKIQICLAVIALAAGLAAAAATSKDSEREVELLRKLFDSEAAPIDPEEALVLLKELDHLYDGHTNDEELSEQEQYRRLVIGLCLVHANVKETRCGEQPFYDFRYLVDALTPYPNMLVFISHFEAKQIALCQDKDPNFKLDIAAIDARIKAENMAT